MIPECSVTFGNNGYQLFSKHPHSGEWRRGGGSCKRSGSHSDFFFFVLRHTSLSQRRGLLLLLFSIHSLDQTHFSKASIKHHVSIDSSSYDYFKNNAGGGADSYASSYCEAPRQHERIMLVLRFSCRGYHPCNDIESFACQ